MSVEEIDQRTKEAINFKNMDVGEYNKSIEYAEKNLHKILHSLGITNFDFDDVKERAHDAVSKAVIGFDVAILQATGASFNTYLYNKCREQAMNIVRSYKKNMNNVMQGSSDEKRSIN